jgi:predicted peptidase
MSARLRCVGVAFLLLTMGSKNLGRAAAPELRERVQTLSGSTTQPVHCTYLLALPADYAADPKRPWPLLLFLHGSGERGGDIRTITRHGLPKLLEGGDNLSAGERRAAAILEKNFIVVSPQCPAGEDWDNPTLLALLDHVAAEQRVDPKRVYVTGISMGGYGTWALAMHAAERFAAVAPISGGGELITLIVLGEPQRKALLSLGIWAFHGAKDPTVPVLESQRMVDAFQRAGATDVKLTIYPRAKHDAWTETYENPELYAWLLRHARP